MNLNWINIHTSIPTLFILLLYLFSSACQGQDQDKPAEAKVQPSLPPWPIQDVDPYFIETHTINSQSGPKSITRNMMEDKNGNIWLATWEGILRYDGSSFTNFTNKANLRRFHAFAVLEDSKGNLWFATIGAGIYRYDGEVFTNFTTKHGIPSNQVTYLYEDRAGNIWIGTESGASRYDGKTFRNFTTADGLLANEVN